MKKTLRWGIVGPGKIANKFAKAMKNIDGALVSSVAARSFEKAEEFANVYNIPNVFGSYEEMANSGTIDVVYIATIHPFHKPCAEIFLNKKIPVLCEKPICVNEKDAVALYECAAKNGVFLMEAMWTRFLPIMAEAKEIIKRGEIGVIRGVDADFCYSSSSSVAARVFENEMAGGSLLDVGVYCLNFAAIFLGDKVSEITAKADIKNDVDHHTSILLKYENQTIASLSSAITVKKPDTGYIYGTNGYIEIPHFYGAKELFVHKPDEVTHIEKPPIGDGFEEEIIEACNMINSGKKESEIMPVKESIRILKQMDYIRDLIGLKYSFDN